MNDRQAERRFYELPERHAMTSPGTVYRASDFDFVEGTAAAVPSDSINSGVRLSVLVFFFLPQRHDVLEAMLGDVEIITIGIGTAGLGIGPTVGTWFG